MKRQTSELGDVTYHKGTTPSGQIQFRLLVSTHWSLDTVNQSSDVESVAHYFTSFYPHSTVLTVYLADMLAKASQLATNGARRWTVAYHA